MLNTFKAALAAAAVATLVGIGGAQAQVDRDGQQRWLDVVNQSGSTIREAYMTDVGTDSWGDDRLGADVVPNGRQYRIVPTARQRARGFCQYDIRLVWENGASWERRRFNLCEATAVVCSAPGRCGVRN